MSDRSARARAFPADESCGSHLARNPNVRSTYQAWRTYESSARTAATTRGRVRWKCLPAAIPTAASRDASDGNAIMSRQLDEAACQLFKPCRNATMVRWTRARLAHFALRHINDRNVPGDILEAGVWRGGMSCYMARTQLLSLRGWSTNRQLWLFDTFEGMPRPTDEDGQGPMQVWSRVQNGSRTAMGGVQAPGKWAYGPVEAVQATLARTRYPSHAVHLVKGQVEQTLPRLLGAADQEKPRTLSLLRLDTDWFASTETELQLLWPLLSPGGWLYVDDYFDWKGARKAVDDWLSANGWTEAAKKAGSFDSRGCRCFNLWKASPYSRARPFATPARGLIGWPPPDEAQPTSCTPRPRAPRPRPNATLQMRPHGENLGRTEPTRRAPSNPGATRVRERACAGVRGSTARC